MRVLLANEPLSYRQVFAGALHALRPHVEVVTVESNAVEEEAPRIRPDAVVCSRTTPALRSMVGVWMEIRLEDGTLLVRTSDTGASQDPNPGLETLLDFVDRSEEARKAGRAKVKSTLEAN
jgi:hypothetical protein